MDVEVVLGHVVSCWGQLEPGFVVALAVGLHVGAGTDAGGGFCYLGCCYYKVVGSCFL